MWIRENIRNKTKVCKREDIIEWARFWQLLITWFWKDKKNKTTILYKCDCWKEWYTYTYDITHGRISCWHDQYTNNAKQAYKHWMWGTWRKWWRNRFYMIYYNITSRIRRPIWRSKCYEGIKCLWNSFEEFKNDMYDSYIEHCNKYWEKETTVDRIDPNWDYCKENCRWATIQEQAYNKKKNIIIEADWEKRCASDVYKTKNPPVNYSTFIRRLKKWFSLEDSLLSKDEFKNKTKL